MNWFEGIPSKHVHLFKVSNSSTRKRYEKCSKPTINDVVWAYFTSFTTAFINKFKKANVLRCMRERIINPLSTNPTKWSSTLKQFVPVLSTVSSCRISCHCFIYIHIYLSIYLSIYLFIYLSICLSIDRYIDIDRDIDR